MSFKSTIAATAVAAVTLTGAAFAEQSIVVEDAYIRSSTPTSHSAAAFMVLKNEGEEDDRLIGVQSETAERVELHTHQEDANGVMKMLEVAEGFPLPAGQSHALRRGGDHVMFMGLTQPLEQGKLVPLTLVFENSGEIAIDVPVDLEREPHRMDHDMKMEH
ncbi:copper chaperone PCu(A)C [Pontibaca salina]|uniref:Copper chaperone PCu(A)C n=1 Tax=Pontibaca salina TaxID=2795731 RepID=A0A934HV85_9RHOB|nr:copper chaperone PCu(A)C [Pontibaca salina]MBI6630159.1 copper chaperone PCu(A)C [Pontibaca salina]